MEDGKNKYCRPDISLGYNSQIKQCIGKHRFNILFKVVKLVLVPPHLNLSEERVISIVPKSKTTLQQHKVSIL